MPIITISRSIFSGGYEVATKLAEQLGYPCADVDDLYESMAQAGFSEENHRVYNELLEGIEEPRRRVAIMNMMRAALLRLAGDGNLVYHGIVGHLLLSSLPNILRVRINTSMDQRIQTAIRVRKLSHGDAAALIHDDDFRCEASARNLYDVDGCDALLYDIVLNLSHISIDSAVDLLRRMLTYPEFDGSNCWQKAYRDLSLSSQVWVALKNNPRTADANVMVTCSGGEVSIHGSAGSGPQAVAIKQIASQVAGVRRVVSDVEIGGGVSGQKK